MKDLFHFRDKRVKQIKLWAWAASILPITALSAIFFVWYLGVDTWFNIVMVIILTGVFTTGILWWWWTLHVLKSLFDHWDETGIKVRTVLDDIREIKQILREIVFGRDTDK